MNSNNNEGLIMSVQRCHLTLKSTQRLMQHLGWKITHDALTHCILLFCNCIQLATQRFQFTVSAKLGDWCAFPATSLDLCQ